MCSMHDGAYKSAEMAKRPAFTLIELLVVIAIIALLLSILVPSLGRARALVRDAACASNQRHIGNAIFLYAADNEGWLPYTAEPANGVAPASENESLNWIERISVVENADYGDPSIVNVNFRKKVMQAGAVTYNRGNFTKGIFKCPSANYRLDPKSLHAGKWDFHFGANMWIIGIRRFTWNGWTWRYNNLSKCRPLEDFRPGLLLLSDGHLGWDCHSQGLYFQYRTSYGYRPWPEQKRVGPVSIAGRGHTNGRTNCTYVDGHVELQAKTTYREYWPW